MKKCINRRCNAQLGDNFEYCPYCGKLQSDKAKKRRRAKGSGSIYYRKENRNNPYTACSNITGKRVYLGSFPSKKEAEIALRNYEAAPSDNFNITLEQLYNKWIATKSYGKLSKSSKQGYNAAWAKLSNLYKQKFRELRTCDYQEVLNYYENPHHEQGKNGALKYLDKDGNATYQVTDTPKICDGLKFSALHKLKCLLTSLYKFAMQDDIVSKDYATFIELPDKEETDATCFTEVQLETIRRNIGKIEYCDYIYAMCYLNFRVSEFLELTEKNYHVSDQGIPYLVGGKKTAAGKNRIVPIHPNVIEIVKSCVNRHGETIFCRKSDHSAMNKDIFRRQYFYPAMDQLGFGRTYTPHSCRRTFSTRMSAAGARAEDIIALMGHTDFEVDKKHYIKQEIQTLYDAVKKMA